MKFKVLLMSIIASNIVINNVSSMEDNEIIYNEDKHMKTSDNSLINNDLYKNVENMLNKIDSNTENNRFQIQLR